MTQLQAVSRAGRAGGRGFIPEFSPATPLVATISGAFVFLFVCFFSPRRRPKCSMVMKRNGAERVWLPHWQLLIGRPSAMEKRKRKNTFWDVTVCPSPRFFVFFFFLLLLFVFGGGKQIRGEKEPRRLVALPGADFGPSGPFRRELSHLTARPDVCSPFQVCKCVTKGFRYSKKKQSVTKSKSFTTTS